MTNLKILLKLFLIILPVFISLNINAQVPVKLRSALSAGGSSKIVMSDGHQYYLQQSIGQPGITGLSQNNNYQLRQGFIQPLAGSINIMTSGSLQATIFPNPFSENIIISFSEKMPDFLYIALYDLNGKIIYFKKHGASYNLIVDAGYLPPGVYFVRISTTTKYYYSKIIKL